MHCFMQAIMSCNILGRRGACIPCASGLSDCRYVWDVQKGVALVIRREIPWWFIDIYSEAHSLEPYGIKGLDAV